MAEVAASNRTFCARCRNRIGAGTLRIKLREMFWSNQNYYHLRCFKPSVPTPIELGKNLFVESIKEEHIAQARKWMEKWNEQFTRSAGKVPDTYLHKEVQTVASPLRRLWLEVLLYLSAKELEGTVAVTTKELFHYTRDEELWRRKLVLEDFSFPPTTLHFRAEYIQTLYERCVRCKSTLALSEIAFKCPYYKRPVCKTCDCMHGYRPQSVNSFCKTWKVDLELLKRLKVPIFPYMRAKSLYLEDCIRLMAPYYTERLTLLQEDARQNRAKLSKEQMEELTAFTPSKFFLIGTIHTWIGSLTHRFCGTNDEKYSLEVSLEDFYESIKRIPT